MLDGKANGSLRESRLTAPRAFTLVELLTVLSIVAFLLAILLPGLSRARQQARAAVCRSNLRQVVCGNDLYAQESAGVYCPGAANMLQNLQRWHGSRDAVHEPFEASRSPLVAYLGPEGTIRRCPSFAPDRPGFEAGNGGYGYNNAYVGVQTVATGPGRAAITSDLSGTQADRVRRPGETLMFTDAAFVAGGLIEYSFAEPRYHPAFGSRADPSIHFRHHRIANVGWCDGHVDGQQRTFTWSSGFYAGDPDRFDIGWFGETDDNRRFDVR